MVSEASLERIGVVELCIVKDASHIIAIRRAFRAGVVNSWELLSANGVSSILRRVISSWSLSGSSQMVYQQHNSRAAGSSGIPIVVPVEICGLQSCLLQNHGALKSSHGDQNWQRIMSIYD